MVDCTETKKRECLVTYIYQKDNMIVYSNLSAEFLAYPPTFKMVKALEKQIAEHEGSDSVIILGWIPLQSEKDVEK